MFVFLFYGGRIQSFGALNSVKGSVNKLETMKDKARKDLIDYLSQKGAAVGSVSEEVDRFIDYVTIMPVSLDPSGIVRKLEHLANTSDERARSEIKSMVG